MKVQLRCLSYHQTVCQPQMTCLLGFDTFLSPNHLIACSLHFRLMMYVCHRYTVTVDVVCPMLMRHPTCLLVFVTGQHAFMLTLVIVSWVHCSSVASLIHNFIKKNCGLRCAITAQTDCCHLVACSWTALSFSALHLWLAWYLIVYYSFTTMSVCNYLLIYMFCV